MFSRLALTFLMLATWAAIAHAALSFTDAYWIWTSDANANTTVPNNVAVTSRAFRKTISKGLIELKVPTSIEVIISTDDQYTLYVNGAQIDTEYYWRVGSYYCIRPTLVDIDTLLGRRVVIAVKGSNTVYNTPAGLIAVVRLTYLGGASEEFVTDSSWVSNMTVPSGFQDSNFDDSSWDPATVETKFGNSTLWTPETLKAVPDQRGCSGIKILPSPLPSPLPPIQQV